jgi:hypothetical protein
VDFGCTVGRCTREKRWLIFHNGATLDRAINVDTADEDKRTLIPGMDQAFHGTYVDLVIPERTRSVDNTIHTLTSSPYTLDIGKVTECDLTISIHQCPGTLL